MPELSNIIVTITATFIHKTNLAVRLQMGKLDPPFFIWIPMSQIYSIRDGENPTDYGRIERQEEYIWDISGWISLKLFDVESIEELKELELDYVKVK